jgi:KaiC/GvpD/RAD55 family RecA-like ATPase
MSPDPKPSQAKDDGSREMAARQEEQEFCAFVGSPGFNRIFEAQRLLFKPEDRYYSWPVPSANLRSCNAVIVGKPGTGKTTLALEMAGRVRMVKVTDGRIVPPYVPATVIYCSLEQPQSGQISRLTQILGKTGFSAEELTADPGLLYDKVNSKENANLILMPHLSPRRLEQTGEEDDGSSIFWQRMDELRRHISDVCRVEKEKETTRKLRMLVIDSLNVFGDRPVSRYLIEQLFALCAENKLIGIFVAEDPETVLPSGLQEPAISPGISYLADVVIKLDWNRDQGYCFRTVEVVKARHNRNVNGPQQVKLDDDGLSIFPSLHWWHTTLTRSKPRESIPRGNRLEFGFEQINCQFDENDALLPKSIIHTVVGRRGTGKTRLAFRYATRQPFLLVSLGCHGDECDLQNRLFSPDGRPLTQSRTGTEALSRLIPKTKGMLKQFGETAAGYQLWMAPGFLLPEELVHYLHEIFVQFDIQRVVIEDVGFIPVRYPVIARQIREHCNFFPVLAELFRRLGVDCCFVCTREERRGDIIYASLLSISHGIIQTSAERRDRQCEFKFKLKGRLVRGGFADGPWHPDDPKWTLPAANVDA